MSTLKVNNIDTQTGTNIVVASGKVLSAPGHIIQIVRKTVDQSGHASSTSSSYTDIASSSLSITPKFANSMIRYSCSIYMHCQTGSTRFRYTIFRDSTDLSTLHSSTSYGEYGPGADGSVNTYDCWTRVAIDFPNTTSAVAYSVQFARTAGSLGLYAHSNGVNEFILEEIAQ
tara:strand:- start:125 stop:640 length:516 start_codon:yes stop_codon:yes gene_type:complete